MEANNLILTLTKLEVSKNYAFLALTTKEARELILEHGLLNNHEKIKVIMTHDHDANNLSEVCISTTLVVINLPQKESQSVIMRTIIVEVSFRYNPKHKEGIQTRWCHIQCLNALVYIEWLNKYVYILGRHVDFIPYNGNIDSLEPSQTKCPST
jgi:hypothetical protein